VNALKELFSKLGGSSALNFLSRSSDLILAVFIVVIMLMIILPVPPEIIDVGITINLTAGIGLLMISLYIPNALQLSTFPSMLLVTTLFRLGVEIATTRQVLLHAYAGEIIHAFGQFVVGGNYIVGFIVFLIITIVQFIVVTKGAERVAEVAARFRLDAMPGKQMAIDADLRAGMIDANQARDKRAIIQKESELYGAMDGAMKFVKGDVIAGIIIAFINIVGGLIIGVFIHGMSVAQSAQVYTLLSIGDGLVTQIPSLLISLCAGIVTTRVSSDDKDSNLGREISSQIFREPRALFLTGGALIGAGFFQGFPMWAFGGLGAMIFSGGLYLNNEKKKMRARAAGVGGTIETDIEGHSLIGGPADDYSLTLPVVLELGAMLSDLAKKSQKKEKFIEVMIPKMRQALYHDMGIRYPGVHVRTDSPSLGRDEYLIFLNEVPVVKGKIPEGYYLTNESEENLRRFNLPFITFKNASGLPALWVEHQYEEIMTKAGIKFWNALEVVILHLSYFYKTNGSEFVGIQEMRAMLEFMEKSFPDLVKEVTRLVPLQKLTEIFKRLIQEQVSIKDLRTIMESLSEWAQTEKDTVLLTEYIRSSLQRYISNKYAQGQSTLSVYLIDPEIEEMVRGAIKQTSAGSYLALDPDSVNMILKSMRNVVTPTPAGGQPPVVLTAIDVRRFVRKLIEAEFPDVSVVSYQEIIPEIRIQPLGRIQIS
jgi:type III secretion protein V